MRNASEEADQMWPATPSAAKILAELKPGEKRNPQTLLITSTLPNEALDPVTALAQKHLGSAVPRPAVPEESLVGLDSLLAGGQLQAALALTARLLASGGPSPSPTSLLLLARRLQLHALLGNAAAAAAEAAPLRELDAPDLDYRWHSQSGKTGSMVPFLLRLMHAEIPSLNGQHQRSLQRLTLLSTTLHKLGALGDSEVSAVCAARGREVWRSLGRVGLAMKDFRLAEQATASLGPRDADDAALLARTRLQLGHIQGATLAIAEFNKTCDQSNPSMKATACLHRGYQSLFQGSYEDASAAFRAALQFEAGNVDAATNLAVSLLYKGDLRGAICVLEEAIHKDPKTALTRWVVVNLGTLYELLSGAECGQRKAALLKLVQEHRPDAFPAAALKLTPVAS